MWTYIVRRLMLMVVTVFGITLVTYLVMRLTPGDPAKAMIDASVQTGTPITKEDLERTRALFNLDKPEFVNFAPTDRSSEVAQRVLDLDDDLQETRERAEPRLKAIGAAGIEPAIALLEQALADEKAGVERTVPLEVAKDGKPRGKLSEHLLQALPWMAYRLAARPESTLDAAGWQAWWKTHGPELTHAKAAAAVETYMGQTGPVAEGVELLKTRYHTLAVQSLVSAMNTSDVPRIDRAMQALAVIAGKPFLILEEKYSLETPEGQKELLRLRKKWNDWYSREGAQTTDLSALQRVTRTFTETQYGTWLYRLLRFDFGESYQFTKPVMEILKPRLWVTFQLSVLSIFFAYIVAVPLGIFSAARPYSAADKTSTVILFVLYSLPSFWVGNLLIALMTGGDSFPFNMPYRSASLHKEPMFSVTWLREMAMPLFCLTYASFAYISRQMRAGMMEVIRADFIRTARAKGLAEHVVILKHALRNSLIPVLTIMANILPALIGGSIIVEQIFSIEGMGKLAFDSVINRDYPVNMAIAFFSAVLTMLGVLFSDLSYALVDPRITYE